MYAHFLNRGHDLNKLINMPYVDKLFYLSAMKLEEENKIDFYNALFGGGG